MARIAHVAAVCLGALLLLVGTVSGVVDREVLDAGRFAEHVDNVRTDPDVARQVGALLTERIVAEQPDLVAVRPLLETTATGVVGSPALEPAVRAGVAPLYAALVLGEEDPVVLRLADVAAVVVAAIGVLAPDVAATMPADLDVRLSRFGGGEYDADLVGAVHLVRLLVWLCPLLGLLLLAGAGALARPGSRVRGALLDTGRGALGAAGLLAVLLLVAGLVVGRSDRDTLSGAVRHAVWDELAGTFWVVAALVAVAGAVLALTSAPRSELSRTLLQAISMVVVGLALVVDPARVATALLWAAGVVLLVAGAVSLLATLARVPAARTWSLVAAGVLVAAIVVGALPGDDTLQPAPATAPGEGCNGSVELCDRRYDEVAFPATHNSMAAASEGWLFPEQPDGIVAQLDHGIRALLIDSWYGRRTDRPGVVATSGAGRERAIAEAEADLGAAAVRSALRVSGALGLTPRGPAAPYLCHALCELGSTLWADSLRAVGDWLAAHPREVVTIVVQDEVGPEDTAALVEEAGLLPYVYTPLEDGEWPTLGQLVASGKRLVVMMENRGGGSAHPWLLQGFDVVTDTPYLFRTPAELAGEASCAPNRGGPDASLLLVNHWVTDKTAEVTNAELVNARAVLEPRLARCTAERGMIPNFVAVDFYDRGDLLPVVDSLNGLGP